MAAIDRTRKVYQPACGVVPSKRLLGLDGLRGIAILLVLVHHLFVFTPADFVGERVAILAEFAGHGVDLFFVLSGFLIARQLTNGANTAGFGRAFWLRRCAKIVPLYLLACLIVFVALKPLLTLTHHPEKLRWLLAGELTSPWYLMFASNILNARDATFTNPALDVSWSLAVEVQFYLLAFVVARFTRPEKWKRIAYSCIILAICFRTFLVAVDAGWVSILALTPGRLDAFALGALAFLCPRTLLAVPKVLIASIFALPFMMPWSRHSAAVEIAGYTLVAIAFAAVVARVNRFERTMGNSWLTSPLLLKCGQISYSVYLTHLPLRAALRDGLLPAPLVLSSGYAWLTQFAYFVVAGGICLGAGWLTWRYVEEPARRQTIKWFGAAPMQSAFSQSGIR